MYARKSKHLKIQKLNPKSCPTFVEVPYCFMNSIRINVIQNRLIFEEFFMLDWSEVFSVAPCKILFASSKQTLTKFITDLYQDYSI
jgi:hypothetical protein